MVHEEHAKDTAFGSILYEGAQYGVVTGMFSENIMDSMIPTRFASRNLPKYEAIVYTTTRIQCMVCVADSFSRA